MGKTVFKTEEEWLVMSVEKNQREIFPEKSQGRVVAESQGECLRWLNKHPHQRYTEIQKEFTKMSLDFTSSKSVMTLG